MRLCHARWLNPDGTFGEGAVEAPDGRLALRPGDEAGGGLDARGLLVLPGLVDPHVHLRAPGLTRKEGVKNGSTAALAGGVTTLLAMPNDRPPTTTEARLDAKEAIYRRDCLTRWGLFLQATPRAADPAFAARMAPRVAGLKIYLARSSSLPALRDPALLTRILAAWPLVTVHAEDEGAFLPGPVDIRLMPHHVQRPVEALGSALALVEAALRALPPDGRPRLVVAHAATALEAAWIARMKAEGFDVWGETCPHYLLFDSEQAEARGGELKVNPPLRAARDQEATRAALREGTLDFLATDHAPHLPAEKADPANPPSGIAGIEWLWPLLLHQVEQGLLPWSGLTRVGCAAAAACYGLPGRDGLRDGNLADLVLAERPPEAPARPVITRAATNPYRHLPLAWRVRATFVGGRPAWRDPSLPPLPESPPP
jgi:dihydroorotase